MRQFHLQNHNTVCTFESVDYVGRYVGADTQEDNFTVSGIVSPL